LIFDSKLYTNKVPDEPGGGTVLWTNPWGGHRYFDGIEAREDGGTPAFLQTIKAALAIKLKEEMGIGKMLKREEELVEMIFDRLEKIPGLHILAKKHRNRLGVIAFYIDDLHYELGTKILNDRFGIQTRAGCSCAGTYGHHLFHISQNESKIITDEIDKGDSSDKPGWMRLSVHPVLTNKEIEFTLDAIEQLVENFQHWGKDYNYDLKSNTFSHHADQDIDSEKINSWFDL
jgi:selenocysteine lyase/cysteine desulfurase